MSLDKYNEKRRFNETPEPRGKLARTKKGALRFVIQKHEASHLHYDFRLEMDGTMKSWAIPKGPSMEPGTKRLAVMTEDHPLDYRTFEGTIPEGNYGAGTVMVWDEGTYAAVEGETRAEQEKRLIEDLEKGNLHFVIKGKKIRGEFSLVRTRRGEEKRQQWLLIKRTDEFASKKDITTQDRSVRSKRSMAEIATKKKKVAERKSYHAMLATLVDEPFDREGWIFEVKWDGYRAIAETGDRISLTSRNGKSFATKFPEIFSALSKIKHDATVDGEVAVLDERGRSSFQLLQQYKRTGRGNLVYYVFDVMYLDGEDLTGLPLTERKARLKKILPDMTNIRFSEHVETKGEDFFAAVQRQKIEGMIAKDGTSPYRAGRRSEEWLKIKTHARQEAVICGFTEPQGARDQFGALLLGVYENKKLVYIGHTGTGFNDKMLDTLAERFEPLETMDCPFEDVPKSRMPVTWLRPKLVCEIKFQEWTEDGMMRQPSFLGLREDKPASAVRREGARPTKKTVEHEERTVRKGRPELRLITNGNWMPSTKKKSPGARHLRSVGKAPTEPTLTNLDKVYFPKDKITKGDIVDYYHAMAPVILPYLYDRPQNLNRHPNGIDGKNFYQKDIGENAPAWLKTVKVHSDSTDKDVRYVVCNDEATLLYLANLGCIELNPWNARVTDLDRPDYLVIDLDPEKIGFAEVIEVAKKVHETLDAAGVESFPKTSGKTGLHIYVPLGAAYDFDQAKQFAEIIAGFVHEMCPKITSVVRNPKERQRKIYLDFLQNRIAQTLAAPYSVRPSPGATVSTPLEWKEVKRGLDPTAFTIRNIQKRLDKKGDLFAPVLRLTVDLRTALENLTHIKR